MVFAVSLATYNINGNINMERRAEEKHKSVRHTGHHYEVMLDTIVIIINIS